MYLLEIKAACIVNVYLPYLSFAQLENFPRAKQKFAIHVNKRGFHSIYMVYPIYLSNRSTSPTPPPLSRPSTTLPSDSPTLTQPAHPSPSSNPSPPPNVPAPLPFSSSSCFSSSPHPPLPSPVTDPPPLPHTPTHLPCPTPPQLPRPTPPHLGPLTPPSPSNKAPPALLRRPRRHGRWIRRSLRRLKRWSRLVPRCAHRLFLLRRLIDAGRRLRCNWRLVLGGRPHRKINSFWRHLQISQRFRRRRILGLITFLGALLRWGCRLRCRKHIFLRPALCVLRAGREAFLRVGRAGTRLPVGSFLGRSARRGRRALVEYLLRQPVFVLCHDRVEQVCQARGSWGVWGLGFGAILAPSEAWLPVLGPRRRVRRWVLEGRYSRQRCPSQKKSLLAGGGGFFEAPALDLAAGWGAAGWGASAALVAVRGCRECHCC